MGCTAAGDDVCVQLPPWRCGHQRIHQAVPVRHVVSIPHMSVPIPIQCGVSPLPSRRVSPNSYTSRSNLAQKGMQRRAIWMMASGSMRGKTGHAWGVSAPASQPWKAIVRMSSNSASLPPAIGSSKNGSVWLLPW